ncbi:response regulator [Paucibacter soli]|uniref:response regulator n=1 Tax=Paucibacter soli TaxID=3133433 RepID=UPI0030AAC054
MGPAARPLVLVIDDEPRNRRLLDAYIEAEGYEARHAASAAHALCSAVAEPPSLILLDLIMPDMDGFELLHRLKADALLSGVPVVVVSALDDAAARHRALAAGAADFLGKPVDRWLLSQCLLRLLASTLPGLDPAQGERHASQ